MIATDGTIDGALAERTRRVVPEGRTFSYVLVDGEPRAHDHPERRAPDPAGQGGTARRLPSPARRAMGSIVSAGSAWPVPSGATSIPCTRSSSGSCPTATRSASPSAGNAAGTGARIALLNRAARTEIEDVVRRVEKVETAVEPRFQEHFVHAMAIPHDTDPYEQLAAPCRSRPGRRRPAPRSRRAPPQTPAERHREETRMSETTRTPLRRTRGASGARDCTRSPRRCRSSRAR